MLAPISDQSVAEGGTLTLTASATDAAIPSPTLAYSLAATNPDGSSPPVGATIDSATGAFTWTPSNIVAGTYSFTVVVSDNGSPAQTDSQTFQVELDSTPIVINTVGDQAVEAGSPLSVQITAVDPGFPASPLTFSLVDAPNGAAITSGGLFSWTPSASGNPGVYPVTVQVNSTGPDGGTNTSTFMVSVGKSGISEPPSLDPISAVSIDAGQQLSLTAEATDPNPGESVTYSLDINGDSAPGAAIDPSTGGITWTPTESDAPGIYDITVRATDSGPNHLTTSTSFQVTVNAVYTAPTLDAIADQTISAGSTLSVLANATMGDGSNVVYSLAAGAPTGAAIDPSSGILTWPTTVSDALGGYPITVIATSAEDPSLSATQTFNVTLTAALPPDVLAVLPSANAIAQGASLTLTADVQGPAGGTIQAVDFYRDANGDGALETGAGGDTLLGVGTLNSDGTYSIAVSTDSFTLGTQTFFVQALDGNGASGDLGIAYVEVTGGNGTENPAPIVSGVSAAYSINQDQNLEFDVQASDPDPSATLTYSLDPGAPAGATISSSGVLTWNVSSSQAAGEYPIAIRVNDNGSPVTSEVVSTIVTVLAFDQPPTLDPIDAQTVDEYGTLSVNLSGENNDTAQDNLSYGIVSAPAGAFIDSTSGAFTWTTDADNAGQSYTATVSVTDLANGLTTDQTFTIAVGIDPVAPTLAQIADQTATPGNVLAFTAVATDEAIAAPLTYSLANLPAAMASASIDPNTGAFTWTPQDSDAGEDYVFTVEVTNAQGESDTQNVNVAISTVALAPVLDSIPNQTVNPSTEVQFTASATDPSSPGGAIEYGLAPAGGDANIPAALDTATIDPTTGAFSWTPSVTDLGQSYQVVVVATNDAGLTASQVVTINVVDDSAVTLDPIADQSLVEGQTIGFYFYGHDDYTPFSTLSYTLTGSPDNPDGGYSLPSLDSASGLLTFSPPEAGAYSFTLTASNGVNSASQTFNITVAPQPTLNYDPVSPNVSLSISDQYTDPSSGLAAVDLPINDQWSQQLTVDGADIADNQPDASGHVEYSAQDPHFRSATFTVSYADGRELDGVWYLNFNPDVIRVFDSSGAEIAPDQLFEVSGETSLEEDFEVEAIAPGAMYDPPMLTATYENPADEGYGGSASLEAEPVGVDLTLAGLDHITSETSGAMLPVDAGYDQGFVDASGDPVADNSPDAPANLQNIGAPELIDAVMQFYGIGDETADWTLDYPDELRVYNSSGDYLAPGTQMQVDDFNQVPLIVQVVQPISGPDDQITATATVDDPAETEVSDEAEVASASVSLTVGGMSAQQAATTGGVIQLNDNYDGGFTYSNGSPKPDDVASPPAATDPQLVPATVTITGARAPPAFGMCIRTWAMARAVKCGSGSRIPTARSRPPRPEPMPKTESPPPKSPCRPRER